MSKNEIKYQNKFAKKPKWHYNNAMDKIIRFSLRISKQLYQAIKQAAMREKRSVNAQILHILETWLDAQGTQNKAKSD